MMDLIFWRHAEAEDGSANGRDADRALTKRGRKHAAKMAKWLSQHLPADTQVLCSPARRCLETAAALHDLNGIEIQVADFLSVESTLEHIAKAVAKVQPNLGLLISRLVGMEQHACVVKKGSVWWISEHSVDGVMKYYIYTIQQPGL